MSPKLVLWFRAGRGAAERDEPWRLSKAPFPLRRESLLPACERRYGDTARAATAGTPSGCAIGAGETARGDEGWDVVLDMSAMENSDWSYLGTAFRETVVRRDAPPVDDIRFRALSEGDAKGSFWLEYVAADGERETVAPPGGTIFG